MQTECTAALIDKILHRSAHPLIELQLQMQTHRERESSSGWRRDSEQSGQLFERMYRAVRASSGRSQGDAALGLLQGGCYQELTSELVGLVEEVAVEAAVLPMPPHNGGHLSGRVQPQLLRPLPALQPRDAGAGAEAAGKARVGEGPR